MRKTLDKIIVAASCVFVGGAFIGDHPRSLWSLVAGAVAVVVAAVGFMMVEGDE